MPNALSATTWPLRNSSLLVLLAGLLLTGAAQQSAAQAAADYRLQPGDQIEVSVWGEEELQRDVLIRPDGKFSFPLTGEVGAAGRTVSEVRTELTTKLIAYIPEAVVTVSVTGIDGNRIYVIGQVQQPGSFVMNPQISVLQALSLAGGTTPFAALDDIIVIRGRGAQQTVMEFPYDNIKRGRSLEKNVQLESGDVVLVP